MPVLRSRIQPRRALTFFVYAFAAVAAILWLLPLLSTHSVLFPPGPTFEDILVYRGRFTLYHSARFFTSKAFSAFAYPAGCAPVYEALYKTSDPVRTYCLLAGTATLAALISAYAWLRRVRSTQLFVPLVVATSFPLVFLIQRANIEIVLWLLVAAGIIAYRRGFLVLAAVLFGLAATAKLYPILLLGLFVTPKAQRQHSDMVAFAAGLLTALFGTIVAVAYTGPTFGVAARGFFSGVSHFQDHYVNAVSRVEIAFDHCLFSPVKYWAYMHHASPAPYTHLYLLLAGTLALLLFLRVRTLPSLNRLLFVTTAMVALPPVSFNYTLVHLYVPLLLLVCALAARRLPETALVALALLLFVLLPLASLSVARLRPTGPMQSIVLLALLIVCCLSGWPETSRAKMS